MEPTFELGRGSINARIRGEHSVGTSCSSDIFVTGVMKRTNQPPSEKSTSRAVNIDRLRGSLFRTL